MVELSPGEIFEERVLRIACALWGTGGRVMLEGRERDGYFESRDHIHLVECTTERTVRKISDDGPKTARSVRSLRKTSGKSVSGWIITESEPTAHQREAAQPFADAVTLLSFDSFRSKLLQARDYLDLRLNYRFGSVYNYQTESPRLSNDQYVPVPLSLDGGDKSESIGSLSSKILKAEQSPGRSVWLLTGEFGMGKSFTLQQIFYELRRRYEDGKTSKVPFYLNLGDHTGQTRPEEALDRHAHSIGYRYRDDLIRAWRAGYAHLILDGFDEMATAGWGFSIQKRREHRRGSMTLVRKLIEESGSGVSIVVSGRPNYFDSAKEMLSALGIPPGYHRIEMRDFSTQEVRQILARAGFEGVPPDWLPSRPLLLGYLVIKGIIVDGGITNFVSSAEGWDSLLEMISQRESRQQEDRLDPGMVRTFLERLASFARASTDGLGRIDVDRVEGAFRDVSGRPSDHADQSFLLRLPGLSACEDDDGRRRFIDSDFVNACKAGDIVRYVSDPFGFDSSLFSDAGSPTSDLTKELVALHCANKGIPFGQVRSGLQHAAENKLPQVALDLLGAAQRFSSEQALPFVAIEGGIEEVLRCRSDFADVSKVVFRDCVIQHLILEDAVADITIPTLERCLIGEIVGATDRAPLASCLQECDVEQMSTEPRNTAEAQRLNVEPPVQVCLTILRRIFLQSGNGRQRGALYKGFDPSHRAYVDEVVQELESHGFAQWTKVRGIEILLPDRRKMHRVQQAMLNPSTASEPLLVSVRGLS